MLDIDDLKGHRGSSVNGIHVTAGRTETGMTAERNIFEITAGRAGIHGTTKRRVATINHFFYIFDDRVTRMLNINHFLKMVFKNLLQNIHKTIMRENEKKETPNPSRVRGRGVEVSETLFYTDIMAKKMQSL